MITVVIPNYNGNKYLKECIDAVYAQEYKDFEIIVIDNASTDGSYEWLEDYPNLILKVLDKNYGFSKAVNEGIKLARGEYVLLLNNDAVMAQGFLEALLEEIEKDQKTFAVCSKMIQYHQRTLIDDAGDEYTLLGWTRKRGDNESINLYRKSQGVFSACAGAAIYRKSIFEEIGYFDENFFAYMEDVDISYRARVYGYHNKFCAKAEIYHIGSATSGSRYNAFKVRLAARNNIYVPYKNMMLVQLIINLPFLILGFAVKYLFFKKKGFGKEYQSGLVEGIRNLNKIDRIPFKLKHLKSYCYIEGLLILNTFKFFISGLRKYLKNNK